MGFTIIGFQSPSGSMQVEAQSMKEEQVWLDDVIYDTQTPGDISHGFIIDEISFDIIRLHIGIAGKEIQNNPYWSETMTVIKNLEELTNTDIIGLLDTSTDKKEALARYLANCQENLQKWESISAYMKQEMVLLKDDMQSCINQKSMSDKQYFDALSNYDQNIMEIALNESIWYEKCATENRIQYNAKVGLAQKLVFYLGLLQKKYDLLFEKQDTITKNFEIFKNNILPDLNKIDALLKQYAL